MLLLDYNKEIIYNYIIFLFLITEQIYMLSPEIKHNMVLNSINNISI
ncbi:hypothetical protein SAMN05216480_10943 [Pustulibacterium marinum]|uniref:Uncharacterized protein n=1 Tax=Pustulibacterium marinum TaxID=1224947 RepID=A0A1I7HGI1_9FLAO|nr:hypothetical protein SAMN05216480_10943 [Pustulibacterium marinum]